jgi:hypothetical protein
MSSAGTGGWSLTCGVTPTVQKLAQRALLANNQSVNSTSYDVKFVIRHEKLLFAVLPDVHQYMTCSFIRFSAKMQG